MKNIKILFLIFLFIHQSSYAKKSNRPFRKVFREVTQLPIQRIQLFLHKPQLSKEKVCYGKHEKQYMWICYPEGVPSNGKAIFFVHGGAWMVGKPEQHFILAKLFTDQGFTVVLPAYRSAIGQHNVYTLREDIIQSFLMSQKQLEKQGIHQWILGGGSAGGNLAALLAFDPALQQQYSICADQFIGYFSLAGALNIRMMRESLTLKSYAGRSNSETFHLANPIERLPQHINFPILVIHGTDDGLVEPISISAFCQRVCQIACNQLEYHFLNHYSHVDVTTKWYYKTKSLTEPKTILLQWVNKISSQ